MRVYDLTNINQIYLSPYVCVSIRGGDVCLEHKLNGTVAFLLPKSGSLRLLWDGIHQGGEESFWRSLLKLTKSENPLQLENLIQRGYLE